MKTQLITNAIHATEFNTSDANLIARAYRQAMPHAHVEIVPLSVWAHKVQVHELNNPGSTAWVQEVAC